MIGKGKTYPECDGKTNKKGICSKKESNESNVPITEQVRGIVHAEHGKG